MHILFKVCFLLSFAVFGPKPALVEEDYDKITNFKTAFLNMVFLLSLGIKNKTENKTPFMW